MKPSVIIVLTIIVATAYGRRIYGGLVMNPKDVPYQAVLLKASSKFAFCGGSFLSKRIVIGAAHCVDKSARVDEYLVSGGGHYYERDSTHFKIEQIFTHEKYDKSTSDNDVAVFVLERVEDFPKSIGFVSLPKKGQEPKVGEKMFVTGYGKSETSDAGLELKGAVVPVYDHGKCRNSYQNVNPVSLQMICAGYKDGGIDTCQGDSGGPMVRPEGTVLFGVTSWGWGCAQPDRPGVYAKVSVFTDWIERIAAKY